MNIPAIKHQVLLAHFLNPIQEKRRNGSQDIADSSDEIKAKVSITNMSNLGVTLLTITV
jgi:hypothetical protein